MIEKIVINGIDDDYTFYVHVINKKTMKEIYGGKYTDNVLATFINNKVYFVDISDDCIYHECLHITFECLRQTVKDLDFNNLLLGNNIEDRNIGEEAIAFTYSEVLSKVKNAIFEKILINND
jgi:hypothetical protein